MKVAGRVLKLLVLDYPIFSLQDPFAAKMFTSIIDLKLRSYEHTYGDVMPFDKSDFFGTHFIVCEDNDGEFTPLATFKSVTHDRCEKYHFEFPGLSLLKSDGNKNAYDSLVEQMEEKKKEGLISYDSSWATDIDHRFSDDIALNLSLLEIVMMITVNYHLETEVKHIVTCGVKRVKTNKFFERLGLKRVHEEAEFKQTNLSSEEVIMYIGNDFSFQGRSMAKKYREIWDERVVIDGLLNKSKVRVAA